MTRAQVRYRYETLIRLSAFPSVPLEVPRRSKWAGQLLNLELVRGFTQGAFNKYIMCQSYTWHIDKGCKLVCIFVRVLRGRRAKCRKRGFN